MDADVVLGQPDFDTVTSGIGPNQFSNAATGAWSDGQKLFVTDFGNHRVLIYNSIPTPGRILPSAVLGSANFTSGLAGPSSQRLTFPRDVCSDGKKIFLSDTTSNRILIWNQVPTTNLAAADVVIGQQDFTSSGVGTSASRLRTPRQVFSDGQRLFIADYQNHRVLIWNSIPTQNGTPADIVVGQIDFTSATSGASQNRLNFPLGVFSDGQRLYISDSFNHRVLIYNSIPTTNFAKADIVIGQPDFTSNTARTTQDGFNLPVQIFSDGKKIFVADFNNNRVLIWNSVPKSNGAPADFVLGQSDFITATSGLGKNKFNGPLTVSFDGKRLITAEATNARVLIYNLSDESGAKLSPQFTQGKAVLGKVFNDLNENGTQDNGEEGLEGIKVISDTGIYSITDKQGKYHMPYIETGQHLLKIDPVTLPEGSTLTTDSPIKINVTKGILTKVSFGVKTPQPLTKDLPNNKTVLPNLSITQDPLLLKPTLKINSQTTHNKLIFTIDCNYFLFIKKSTLTLFNKDHQTIKTITLPNPIPRTYEIPLTDLPTNQTLYYQLSVYDKDGHEDRTSLSEISI